jgi:ankyrin repeat protein
MPSPLRPVARAACVCLAVLLGAVAWYQRPALRQARLNQHLIADVKLDDVVGVRADLAAVADPNVRNYYRDPPSVWLRLRYPQNVLGEEQNYLTSWEPVLMTAVREDDARTVRALLSHGADVNARDAQGGGALAPATTTGYVGHSDLALVTLLLDHGADTGCRDEALLTSAFCGDVPAARLLIARGADVNTRIRSWGETFTPLTEACLIPQMGSADMVKLLIAHGADVNFRDEYRITPLREAMGWRHPDPRIVRMLKQAGARP